MKDLDKDFIPKILAMIKKTREEKNISLAELAGELGISAPSYYMIEKGETALKVKTMYEIFNFLNIKLEDDTDKTAVLRSFSDYELDTFATKDDLRRLEKKINAENGKIQQQNEEIMQLLKEILKEKGGNK